MDPAFSTIADDPWNKVFGVVFFPDRIYHAQYLNATRSSRYRYDVTEVRTKVDINVLKGTVYMDGLPLSTFIRIEYRASRLVEVAREEGRFVTGELLAEVELLPPGEPDFPENYVKATVKLRYCPWIDAYQVEIWQNLEPHAFRKHDFQILDMIGAGGSIVSVSKFTPFLDDPKGIRLLRLRFRENDVDLPYGYKITKPRFDNFFERNIQVPNRSRPDPIPNGEPLKRGDTTLEITAYTIDFQRGWFVPDVGKVVPTRYKNPLMEPSNPDFGPDNFVDMRWIFQEELGGSMVFFHEVTVPPGKVEGSHQHIGSEELYFIIEGEGLAYMRDGDDPGEHMEQYPVVDRTIYGIGIRRCRELPVKPGSAIFTKSGGMHGIANPGDKPLKFVAFLYHS